MSAVFARTALRSSPDLFTRVVRFNQHPAATLHRDHIPSGIEAALFDRLIQSPRGEHKLSGWIARQAGLSPDGFWRFEYPPQRIAVLEPGQLLALARFAAATAEHGRIVSLIGGGMLRDVKQVLGDAAYNFALKRAALTIGPKPLETDTSAPLSGESLARSGASWLRTCLGADSPELLKRTSIKLPAAFAILPETAPASIDRDRCWKILKRILLTEIAPELAPCFN
ncbi:MAG TPA: SctK family type III secretion system sorting platform protein [Caulifigura sp.]|jgi:hypothetical protein|nr:SctK family type III secretion system sorting platform protein [Caulifigura sp.]